jgi:hypothetical protein
VITVARFRLREMRNAAVEDSRFPHDLDPLRREQREHAIHDFVVGHKSVLLLKARSRTFAIAVCELHPRITIPRVARIRETLGIPSQQRQRITCVIEIERRERSGATRGRRRPAMDWSPR